MDNVTIIRIVAGLITISVFVLVGIFYNLTLSRALKKCSPALRTMQPGMVWLSLIPLFGFIWNFFVVLALAKSLGNEFRVRGIQHNGSEPGKAIGITMCVCIVCSMIPMVTIIAGLPCFILWIIYWVKIAGYSRLLDMPLASAVASAGAPAI